MEPKFAIRLGGDECGAVDVAGVWQMSGLGLFMQIINHDRLWGHIDSSESMKF